MHEAVIIIMYESSASVYLFTACEVITTLC